MLEEATGSVSPTAATAAAASGGHGMDLSGWEETVVAYGAVSGQDTRRSKMPDRPLNPLLKCDPPGGRRHASSKPKVSLVAASWILDQLDLRFVWPLAYLVLRFD